MHGNDRVRFCDHCAKNVTDLSQITRKRAKRIVRKSNGHLCVRYVKHPVTNTPVYADDFVQIQRRTPSFAAGVMSASLLLSTAGYAQGQVTPVPSPSVQQNQQPGEDNGVPKTDPRRSKVLSSLRGTVTDPNDAVVSGAEVTITNESDNASRVIQTDETGTYRFDGLEGGKYIVQITSPGFRRFIANTTLVDGNEKELKSILDVGAVTGGVVVVAVEFDNPLMSAVSEDDLEAVRDLIAKGERVNYRDKENENTTPLFLAVENGNVEMARMLLEFGAKVNARDSAKQTPLMRLDGDATAELVELLLHYGAKIDLKDKNGNTALIIAAEDAKPEVIKALLGAKPDVNAANDEGQTALMNAANDDSLEKVEMLLLAGADVNTKNKEGDTAWDLTSEDEIEDLLVSFGATVEEEEEEEPVEVPISN